MLFALFVFILNKILFVCTEQYSFENTRSKEKRRQRGGTTSRPNFVALVFQMVWWCWGHISCNDPFHSISYNFFDSTCNSKWYSAVNSKPTGLKHKTFAYTFAEFQMSDDEIIRFGLMDSITTKSLNLIEIQLKFWVGICFESFKGTITKKKQPHTPSLIHLDLPRFGSVWLIQLKERTDSVWHKIEKYPKCNVHKHSWKRNQPNARTNKRTNERMNDYLAKCLRTRPKL